MMVVMVMRVAIRRRHGPIGTKMSTMSVGPIGTKMSTMSVGSIGTGMATVVIGMIRAVAVPLVVELIGTGVAVAVSWMGVGLGVAVVLQSLVQSKPTRHVALVTLPVLFCQVHFLGQLPLGQSGQLALFQPIMKLRLRKTGTRG
jgi:hypothetical protein